MRGKLPDSAATGCQLDEMRGFEIYVGKTGYTVRLIVIKLRKFHSKCFSYFTIDSPHQVNRQFRLLFKLVFIAGHYTFLHQEAADKLRPG
jgi:hypothetical protein